MNFTVQLHLAITPDPNPLYSKANSHKVEPEEIWDVYKKCIHAILEICKHPMDNVHGCHPCHLNCAKFKSKKIRFNIGMAKPQNPQLSFLLRIRE